MSDTGRLTSPVPREIRSIVFGLTMDHAVDNDLPFMSEIDRAHVVMLHEQGLLPQPHARALLARIADLRATGFSSLRPVEPVRGSYLAYEQSLIEQLGMTVGGALHTGRSRNDLNATLHRLKLRRPVRRVLLGLLHLLQTLIRRAGSEARAVMPIYTHYQQAAPATFGFYLAGVAFGVTRDIREVLHAADDLETCPLGATAVAGSSLPIAPDRTSELLGFLQPADNSLDAVASRDFVLRIAAASAAAATTLSRIATDLLLWSSREYGFILLPDFLVGSSSHLPQKRNPFLLEHVQARASSAIGAFTSACFAMSAKPYTNGVAVGTESVRHIWQPLADLADSALLLRRVLEGLELDYDRMATAVGSGFASAAAVAQALADAGTPFREAHHIIGQLVTTAEQSGRPLLDVVRERFGGALDNADLTPTAIASSMESGGGPGTRSMSIQISALADRCVRLRRQVSGIHRRHRQAAVRLDEAVQSLCLSLPSTQATHEQEPPQ